MIWANFLYAWEFYRFAFYIYAYDSFQGDFCKGCKACVLIHFLARGCAVIPAPFAEKTVFAPLYRLCSFVKDQLPVLWEVCF